MPAPNTSRSIVVILALTAGSMLTAGCSSANTQSALSSLRGFASAAHPAGSAIAATKQSIAIHRHAREHTLSSVRTPEALHHQSARIL